MRRDVLWITSKNFNSIKTVTLEHILYKCKVIVDSDYISIRTPYLGYPIFVYKTDNEWAVTSDLELLNKTYKLKPSKYYDIYTTKPDAKKEFQLLKKYILIDRVEDNLSPFENVYCGDSEIVVINKKTQTVEIEKVEKKFRYINIYSTHAKNIIYEWWRKSSNYLNKIISENVYKTITYKGHDATCVYDIDMGLSGGMDSRLLIKMIDPKNYDRLFCRTYEIKSNKKSLDLELAKQVSDKLGFKNLNNYIRDRSVIPDVIKGVGAEIIRDRVRDLNDYTNIKFVKYAFINYYNDYDRVIAPFLDSELLKIEYTHANTIHAILYYLFAEDMLEIPFCNLDEYRYMNKGYLARAKKITDKWATRKQSY